ncbi:MAG: hypothetical protein D6754_03470, partial [Alphaproteobacteria bacterium]
MDRSPEDHAMRLAGCALLLALALSATTADAQTPLHGLADAIPAGFDGPVHLADLAAIRRENTRIWPDLSEQDLRSTAFFVLRMPGAADLGLIPMLSPEFETQMGFPLTAIEAMAGWKGRTDAGPDAFSVMLGGGDLTRSYRIADALWRRGYYTEVIGRKRIRRSVKPGVTVWSRGRDFQTDRDHAAEDVFSGSAGQSTRIAIIGDALWVTHGWPAMMRAIGARTPLVDDPSVAAMLEVMAARRDWGSPVQMTLLGAQPDREDILARLRADAKMSLAEIDALIRKFASESPGLQSPPLPAFSNHAIAQWRDGARIVGALLIPYRTAAEAEDAVARFGPLLGTIRSFVVKK